MRKTFVWQNFLSKIFFNAKKIYDDKNSLINKFCDEKQILEEEKNWNCDKTQELKLWQNLKTEIWKISKLKLWQNWKTWILTK